MADNVGYTPGTGATVGADEIAGVLYQRNKIVVGADGTATDLAFGQGLAAASLPVVLASDQTLPLPSGAATSAKQDTGNTSVASIDTKTPALGQALAASSVPVVLTAAQITTLTPPTSVTVTQGTGTNLHTVVDSGTITTITNVVHVDDNSGSITVDAPVGTPAFVRLSDGASAITTLPVSLASVPSHAVTVASGGIASGAIASGAIASGAIASGAIASGAVASGAFASGSVSDGAVVTLGAKTDAKSTATDSTSITAMQVLKQISASVQAPPSQAVTNAGTFAVQAAGDVANDGVDSGNPVKVGGQARTTNPTAVADADRVNFICDKLGKQIVVGAIRDLKGNQQTSISASTSETTIVTAVASTFLDLYGLILANTGATTTKVSIRDDTGGTVRMVIEVPTLETRGFMLPVDSAMCQTAVNKNWTATCASSTTALEVTALFVKNT